MQWNRNNLWSGIVRWGNEGDKIVIRRTEDPTVTESVDMVYLNSNRRGGMFGGRHSTRYAHYDGMLYVSDEKPARMGANGEITLIGRIAQHIDAPYTCNVPADEVEQRDVPRVAPHAAFKLIAQAVNDAGDNPLLCSRDDWNYAKWREACALVTDTLAQSDAAFGDNRARSSVVAIMPPNWFQAIRRDVNTSSPAVHSPMPFLPTAMEAQGQGDAFIYVSPAVKSPVLLPFGGVHLMRSISILDADLRIVCLTTPWRLRAACGVIDAEAVADAEPSFDGDSFAARRKAKRRMREMMGRQAPGQKA